MKLQRIHIGKLVEKEIKALKYNREELADQLGIHRNTIYNLYQMPSVDSRILCKLSMLLGKNFFKPYLKVISPIEKGKIEALEAQINALTETVTTQKRLIQKLEKIA